MNKILVVFFLFSVGVLESQVNPLKENRIRNIEMGKQMNDTLVGGSLNLGNNTSNKNIKNENVKIGEYKIISIENDTVFADTTLSIKKYYKYNYLRKDNFDLLAFSNMGQPFNSLSYDFADTRLMPNFVARALHPSYKEISDVFYYYVPTPYTELMYKTGFQQGQILESLFTVNTSNQFNISLEYKGLRSLGNYQHSLTSIGNFTLSTNYKAVDGRYSLRAHLAAQDILNQQNGGLEEEDIINFESGNPEFLDRSVFDPVFENAENFLKGNRYYFEQSYNLIEQKDSLSVNTLSLGNRLSYEDKFYKFKQSSPNDFFGNAFVNSTLRDDVTLQDFYIDINAKYLNNTLGFFNFKLALNKYNYGYNKLVTLDGNDITNRLKGNVMSVGGEYYNKFENFEIQGKFGLNITGEFTGNYLFGNAKYYMNDDIDISIGVNINTRTPNYNYLLYQSDYINYNWFNDFDNVRKKQLSLKLRSDKLLNIEADYTAINNYTYFGLSVSESLVRPFQYENTVNYFRLKIEKELKWYNLALNNTIRYQKIIDGEGILNVPEMIIRSTFYYSNHLFKKALFLQTGITVNYFTSYNMNGYDPLLGEFYVQNKINMEGYPRLDFFLNAKIRQTRIFFIAEHFNSSFTGYNYYSAPNYPYRDFTVRFGLVWNFFL